MEAYFNELTVGLFFGNKEAKDAFSLLGRCLGKFRNWEFQMFV